MSKPKGPTIQECPDYGICKEMGLGCNVCLELDVTAWGEHVWEGAGIVVCSLRQDEPL